MTALDFLPNPPIKQELITPLFHLPYPNPSPIDPRVYREQNNQAKALAQAFQKESVRDFDYSSGSFLELFWALSLEKKKLAIASSLHYNALKAAKEVQNLGVEIFWLHPNVKSGVIEPNSLQEARTLGFELFFLPWANEDLLTLNPLESYGFSLDERLFVEASYPLALGIALPLLEKAHWLINGEILGLPRGYGAILGGKIPLHRPLMRANLFGVLHAALKAREILIENDDQKTLFYEHLSALLGENLSLFAPLKSCLPNALPLRFKGIRARSLIQALLLEKITSLNGQECLFGFSKPSSVLQSMGYDEDEARELLSVSFLPFSSIEELERIAKILALRYKQIHLYS